MVRGDQVSVDGQTQHAQALVEIVLPHRGVPLHHVLAAPDVVDEHVETGLLTTDLIDEGGDLPLEAGNSLERNAFAVLFGSADQKEGMAAFLAKRPPAFKGA